MDRKNYIFGLICGAAAFTLWGLLPLYWQMIKALDAYQIFGHRVLWSLIFLLLVLKFKKNLSEFTGLMKNMDTWKRVVVPAVFISINWLTYIWAVNNGYVIEAALGYYINPLVLTFFGAVFFKEKLSRLEVIGLAFAFVGVLIKTLSYGEPPLIAIVLAVSFALYGLFKKKSPYQPLIGLGFETLIVSIPAFIYLSSREFEGVGIIGNHSFTFFLLVTLSGALTAIPLLLYGEGTKRLPLSVVGFLQYIAPTIGLILGVYVFKEPFEMKDIIPFIFIWIGLVSFTYRQVKLLSKG